MPKCWQQKLHLLVILLILQTKVFGQYRDYYYSTYDEEMRSQLFTGASVPKLHVPFTIAVLNQTYCNAAQNIMTKVDPVYRKMMVERNVHLRVVCNYSAPQSISQAIQLYQQLRGNANTLDGVDALIGDYNPLVSTIASSLNLTFIIVDAESDTLNNRLQEISSVYTQSPAGSVLGSYADLNNYTFVPDTFWYRTFLYGSILDPTGLGQQVFGSLMQNFQQVGVICDDSVLLSQFVVVDKGPFITSLVTMQLDSLYPLTAAALNNVTAISMDSWTSKFSNVTALMISMNSTYSMMLLPQILQSLLNVGYFTPQTVTVLTNYYINQSYLIQYSDLQSTIYGFLGTSTLNLYNYPYPVFNISLPPSFGFLPVAPLVFDPVVQAVSLGLYFFSMQLLQVVYQPSYVAYAIHTQNWPSILTQHYYVKYSVTYGMAQLQYNRCTYLSTVLQLQATTNCSIASIEQNPLTIFGFWTGSNFLTATSYTYTPKTTNSSPSQSVNATLKETVLTNQTLRVGIVIDNPWIISCQECEQAYNGYAIDILGNLSLVLKFSYTLYLQPDYTTLMSKLASGSLDMGVGGIYWTNNTNVTYGHNVKLMVPFLDSGVNLLIRNDTSTQWWSWLSPYSNLVWYTWLIIAIILTFAFMALDTIDPNRLGKRLLDFFASYWYVFGSLTQSAVEIMPITISTKLLSMVMWFTVIIYASTYTAAYTSALILDNTLPFVSTMPAALDYYRSSNDPYYLIANSSAVQYLSSSSYSDLFARAMQSPRSYVVKNAFEAAGHLLDQFTMGGFIGDARVNQWMSNVVDCWLVTVGDIDAVYSTYYSIIALPPNTPYYNLLRIELINLERFRVLATMKEFYFDSQCSSSSPPLALNLNHLAGLYIALAAGCAISLFSTAVMMLMKKLQLRAARDVIQRQRPFQFGQKYLARIQMIRENGLMLKIYRSERDEWRDATGKVPEHPPLKYSMLLSDLNVGNAKLKKPHEMGLREGCRIHVKYLGFNPDTDNDRFMFYKNLDSRNDAD